MSNDKLAQALRAERDLRILGQQPDVHWESLRDMRRAVYAATDEALAAHDAEKQPRCPHCAGTGYSDAWTMDGDYNPAKCDDCNGTGKAEKQAGPVAGQASAPAPEHVPVSPEREAAIDAASGLVLLPPIRVTAEVYAELKAASEASGLIVQAVVRDRISAPCAAVGAETECETWRALCEFLLVANEPMAFLRAWNEGNFDACKREWPEAPAGVYPASVSDVPVQNTAPPSPLAEQAGPVAGWKLVPELPTKDMEHAGIAMLPNAPDVAHWWIGYPKAVYRAMLAAAPSAPPSESAQVGQAGPVAGQVVYLHRLSKFAGDKWVPATELIAGEPAPEWVELAASKPDLWRVDRRVTGVEIARGIVRAVQASATDAAPPSPLTEQDKEDAEPVFTVWCNSETRQTVIVEAWKTFTAGDEWKPAGTLTQRQLNDAIRAARAKKEQQ